jgi:hypothetical protein
VWFFLNSDAHECSSGLIYAFDQSQCSTYTNLHTLGGWGALIGIVVVIIGIVKK